MQATSLLKIILCEYISYKNCCLSCWLDFLKKKWGPHEICSVSKGTGPQAWRPDARAYMVAGEKWLCTLSSDTHMCAVACALPSSTKTRETQILAWPLSKDSMHSQSLPFVFKHTGGKPIPTSLRRPMLDDCCKFKTNLGYGLKKQTN